MKKLKPLITSISLIISIAGCSNQNLKSGEGFLEVSGGKIWYGIFGSGKEIPIIVLHGGPGYPSYSLNQLTDLSSERPVVMYDQLGCGRSDRITDTTLMTIEAYKKQLKTLLKSLDIKDYYLYGHSWGTILGLEYFHEHPDGIKGLILSSPCLNLDLWLKDADILISKLSDSTQYYLKKSIENKPSDPIKTKEAIDLFYNTYYTTKQPISKDMRNTIEGVGLNVYEYMWGKEDYVVTGTLQGYDITNRLNNVNVPTLYLTGEHDAARPSTVEYYSSLTPNSKLHIIGNAGHQTVHDNPKEVIAVIRQFIHSIEQTNNGIHSK